jgi:hypothetical protein
MICLGNDSGGPKLDIIQQNITGYLAKDLESYTNTLADILNLDDKKYTKIVQDARNYVEMKFSEESFRQIFIGSITEGV